ncbi:hypothetical protein CRYUN_Cryun14cG0083700 [Craigia yunnanensis]
MTTRKRRENIQRVIVVLQGEKVSTEKIGIVPLWRASKYVSNTEDEILVLNLLSLDGSEPSSSKGFHGDHQCNYTCEEDPYIRFLRQEIRQRKEDYKRIFRPFYIGYCLIPLLSPSPVSLVLSVPLQDTSISGLSGIQCNVSLVSDVEGALVHDHLIAKDESKSSMLMEITHNPKSPKLMKGSTSQEEQSICHWPSTSREIEQETMCEPLIENETPGQVEPTGTTDVPYSNFSARVSEADFMVERPSS